MSLERAARLAQLGEDIAALHEELAEAAALAGGPPALVAAIRRQRLVVLLVVHMILQGELAAP
ncbi:MAG TPA: hypothetical protein VEA38_09385 [Terriglobales bacterium]|nr:hypothetical protein [Terriglobales bacterium]